jgi:hypothetical protein
VSGAPPHGVYQESRPSAGVEWFDGRERVPGESEQAGLGRADVDRIGHREAGGYVAFERRDMMPLAFGCMPHL